MRQPKFLVALLCLCLAFPVLADNEAFKNVTHPGFTAQTIAASGTATLILDLGNTTIQGAGYSFTTTGAINVTGAVTYSDRNLAAGSANWEAPSSIHSSTLSNTFSITADKKRTNWLFAPARYVKIVLTNADTVPVTLNWFTFFKP